MCKLTKETFDRLASSSRQPEGDWIRVGMSTCGLAAGAEEVYNTLEKEIQERGLSLHLRKCGCLGQCSAEPLVELKINGQESVIYGNVDEEMASRIIEEHVCNGSVIEERLVRRSPLEKRIVLRNCGLIDPESIEEYLAAGGYQAIRKALFDMTPEQVIGELKVAALRGRGGAGFPTYMKWTNARKSQSDEKFLICNGDEGDPGAYMDRSVLEGDPHSVVEGMILGGYAIGATHGFVYIRAEYPLAIERVDKTLTQARKLGLLGENILGSGFSFDLEIRLGAGAFVCGEETALMASIEGKRGTPRPRPPFPTKSGLWGKPTCINNVETLANIAPIIQHGGEWFASIGTEESKGTKVFALTGKAERSGLVEIPMGTSLSEIVYDIGGGTIDGKEVIAVQTGGPSGGLIPVDHFDTPVSFEHLQKLGSIMGSGGMIVMNEDDCVVDVAKFYLGFCVDESCGKCAPCRIGGMQMLNILTRITEGKGELSDLDKLSKIAHAMQKASLCGLGQSAPNPVISSLHFFRQEYIDHIEEKKCRARRCTELLSYTIEEEKCKNCGVCFKNCPVDAISGDRQKGFVIDQTICTKCGHCVEVCRFDAVTRG